MTTDNLKRIGLVGCGTIGSYIANEVVKRGIAKVDFAYDIEPEIARSIPGSRVLEDPSEITGCDVDLVIEAATYKAAKAIAPQVLTRTDLLIFSATCLADDALRDSFRRICRNNKTRLFIPHGAILGLDGISDGRTLLEAVSITTTKNPKNLGLRERIAGVLYDGPTRGACEMFPRNVNAHACAAIAGLGFDRTRSVVVADPDTNEMTHEIHVSGKGIEWSIHIQSRAIGSVTGSYTPESAVMTVRRILATDYDIILA